MKEKFFTSIQDLLAVTLLAVVGLNFFSPLIFGDSALFHRDLTSLAYPTKHFLAQYLNQGQLPLWNPTAFHGFPYMAAMYLGVLYPPNLIFYLEDFTAAFNLFNVFHFLLFALSIYALARFWKLSVFGALCSALTALLGGYFLALVGANSYFLAVAWTPLFFLFFQKYLLGRQRVDLICAALALTCQILAGSPEVNVLSVLLVFAHSVFMLPGGGRFAEFKRRALALLAANLLALALAAPQLIPTYLLVQESTRTQGLSFEKHAQWSMEPDAVYNIVAPRDHNSFQERFEPENFGFIQNFHLGLFSPFAFFAAFLCFRKKEVWFWTGMFCVGLFFALGKNNPWYQGFYEFTPLFDLFRYPEKFYLISALSQVFLVGYFMESLANKAAGRTGRILAVLAFSLAYVGVILWTGLHKVPEGRLFPPLFLLLVFIFAYFQAFQGNLRGWTFKGLLLVLIFWDLNAKHHDLVPVVDRSFYDEAPPMAREIQKDPGLFRVYTGNLVDSPLDLILSGNLATLEIQQLGREWLMPLLGSAYGINYAHGPYPLGIETYDHALWRWIFVNSPPAKRLVMLERSNVKYWTVGDDPDKIPKGVRRVKGMPLAVLENPLPRMFIAGAVQVGKDPQLLNTYYDPAFDPLKTALVAEPVALRSRPDFKGEILRTDYQPDRVKLDVRQNGEGILVLLDSWAPGWKVYVDGNEAPLLRVDHFFRGVKLRAGSHRVKFQYVPPGYVVGCFICFLAGLVLVGYLFKIRPPGPAELKKYFAERAARKQKRTGQTHKMQSSKA